MPNLVALQQAGTTMSRYYVVDSLCCPSRSAIFTGQYPHDDGVFTNAGNDGGYFAFNKHGAEQQSVALAPHDAGHGTAVMGKYLNHYQPADANPPPWLAKHPPLSAADQATITDTYRKRVEDDLSVDDMIGELENELRAKGLDRNTYIVFSSDNGFHMGEYTLTSGKQTAFETDI